MRFPRFIRSDCLRALGSPRRLVFIPGSHMLVAKYYNNNDIRLEELPIPKIGPGEILVKVRASGICGTDVMEWYRIKKAPRILGHEIAGEIIESKSRRYQKGQRVFVSHHVPCNQCKYCRAGNHTACDTLHRGNYDPGGYSEFIRAPKINVDYGVYVLPDQVSYAEGTMIEPLACGDTRTEAARPPGRPHRPDSRLRHLRHPEYSIGQVDRRPGGGHRCQ